MNKVLLIRFIIISFILPFAACSDINENNEYEIIEIIEQHLMRQREDVVVREKALLGANSVSLTNNGFIITLNTDKELYSIKEAVSIWGTLEFVGDNDIYGSVDAVMIRFDFSFMSFHLDGIDNPFAGAAQASVYDSEIIIEKGKVYHFDYRAPGVRGNSDLRLSAGEHSVSLTGGFRIIEFDTDEELENGSGLKAEIKFTVIE